MDDTWQTQFLDTLRQVIGEDHSLELALVVGEKRAGVRAAGIASRYKERTRAANLVLALAV